MPVAGTSKVRPPTTEPVLTVAAAVQLVAMVKDVESTTVTAKVALLMVGLKLPPLTPVMVTRSPVFKPWAIVPLISPVVMRQGLLTMTVAALTVGATVQSTPSMVNEVGLVTVTALDVPDKKVELLPL